MDDYLQELSEIPWINVVESVRAWDQYCYGSGMFSPRWTILHRTFGLAVGRDVSGAVDTLIKARPTIIMQYIDDTLVLPHEETLYSWDKPEGSETVIFSKDDLENIVEGERLGLGERIPFPENQAVWLSIRRPWEIIQDNQVSIMRGRFGCAVFHKDAKRVED